MSLSKNQTTKYVSPWRWLSMAMTFGSPNNPIFVFIQRSCFIFGPPVRQLLGAAFYNSKGKGPVVLCLLMEKFLSVYSVRSEATSVTLRVSSLISLLSPLVLSLLV